MKNRQQLADSVSDTTLIQMGLLTGCPEYTKNLIIIDGRIEYMVNKMTNQSNQYTNSYNGVDGPYIMGLDMGSQDNQIVVVFDTHSNKIVNITRDDQSETVS
jgi:hypothetical protein